MGSNGVMLTERSQKLSSRVTGSFVINIILNFATLHRQILKAGDDLEFLPPGKIGGV